MQYELTTPCTAADLAPLKAGDTVLLSGVVYTARDQAHKRMIEALDKGEALPFRLRRFAFRLAFHLPVHSTTHSRLPAEVFSMATTSLHFHRVHHHRLC